MLLGHTKHHLSQPYSPKRVQVFPTNSKGAQGGRPETQNTARHSVKGTLAAWSKQERACRQGSAASVVACAVLMGALPWQALQHPKGPGPARPCVSGLALGATPCPGRSIPYSRVQLGVDTGVRGRLAGSLLR